MKDAQIEEFLLAPDLEPKEAVEDEVRVRVRIRRRAASASDPNSREMIAEGLVARFAGTTGSRCASKFQGPGMSLQEGIVPILRPPSVHLSCSRP